LSSRVSLSSLAVDVGWHRLPMQHYTSPYSAPTAARLRQRGRRQRSSISLLVDREAPRTLLSFARRRAGSLASLGIGVLVGLLIASLLGGSQVRQISLLSRDTSAQLEDCITRLTGLSTIRGEI
jgi:hypothetical protein